MRQRIQVFCTPPCQTSLYEVADFIDGGSYFDEIDFSPSISSGELKKDLCRTLDISYEDHIQPISCYKVVEPEEISKETEELISILEVSRKTSIQQSLKKKLQETSLVFILEFDEDNVSEEAWEMLDSLESFLAVKCNGVIYSPDDSFLDQDLNRIYKL
jgi:hypothetical protein